MQILSAIQQITQTEPTDPYPPLFKKLNEHYAKYRTVIPPSARICFHKALPFLSPVPPPSQPSISSTSQQQQHNSGNMSAWTLLEDYPDGPLSPSMWGGGRVERTEPTYAKVAFEHAEPPPTTKRAKTS